jgi:predicted MPP superfamily phosphohydrolase
MGALLVDIVRLLNYFFHFLPSSLYRNYGVVKLITACSIFTISFIIIVFGCINAASPKLKKLELDIKANSSPLKKLECIFMSDIHLGSIINRDRLSNIIDISNSVNPDIVLLGGDIVDQHINHIIDRNLGDVMTNFKSKYGVFAVLGNHEYFGGYESVIEYFEKYNIKFLVDIFIPIENSFIIAGRHDASSERLFKTKRKSINEIVSNNRRLPIILLDHQPINLDEAVKEKISLQLSGHTHDGQIWPMSFITNHIWEIAYGYKKIEDTQFYVSSGVGTWGPPVRVGNRPEIVHITINFVD